MINIDELIDKYLEKHEKVRGENTYYVTDLVSCLRESYFRITNPKSISKEKRRIFHAGDIIHDFIYKVLARTREDAGISFLNNERSISIYDANSDISISGRLDDFIILEKGGNRICLEVKSARSVSIEKPSDEHVLQLQPYLKASNANLGILVYVEKNTLKTKQFEIPYDSQKMQKLIKRANELHSYIVNKKIPPKEVGWKCKYCDYTNECLRKGLDANSKNV